MKPAEKHTVHRRGSTLSGIMAAIGIVSAFAAVVYIVVPSDLHGSAAASRAAVQPTEARYEDNQRLIESLATLIGQSAEVIAIHPRTASPYMEIVLRLHDSGDDVGDGVPGEDIAVISHSSILHTIMMYTLEAPKPGRNAAQSRLNRAAPRPFTRQDLADPGFCDQWRSDPNIRPRLLARGLSDMQMQVLEESNTEGTTLRLSLTWSPDSADGGDTAAVLVNAMMHSEARNVRRE